MALESFEKASIKEAIETMLVIAHNGKTLPEYAEQLVRNTTNLRKLLDDNEAGTHLV